ncbi:MAG: hypothetical protein ABI905_11205 [Betaproteobacteria bacterium]
MEKAENEHPDPLAGGVTPAAEDAISPVDESTPAPRFDEMCHWGVECALEFVELHCTGWKRIDMATTPSE